MHRRNVLVTCAIVATISIASQAATRAADEVVGTSLGSNFLIDPTFGEAGSVVDNFGDPAIVAYVPVRAEADAEGYWLLGYRQGVFGYDEDIAVARLQLNGDLDPAFGDGGHLTATVPMSQITDAVRTQDGRVYATGRSSLQSGNGAAAITCVEANGAACAGFGVDAGAPITLPGFDGKPTRLLYRDGFLFVIGTTLINAAPSSNAVAVAKLDASTGALATSFGNGSVRGMSTFDIGFYPSGATTADAAVFGADAAANGIVLVAGSAQADASENTEAYVLAFDTATGIADNAFGNAGIARLAFALGASFSHLRATALAVQADGRIAVAGNAEYGDNASNTVMDVLLASLEADGSRVEDFAGGGLTHAAVGHLTYVRDIALRANGAFVVAMSSLGLAPDAETEWLEQSLAEFDSRGEGPTATVSLQFPAYFGETGSSPRSVHVDAENRVVLVGSHFYGVFGPLLTAGIEMTTTRFVTDAIFAAGFEAL